MKSLSLLIPGLLGPLPELAESPLKPGPCRSLQSWLARGDSSRTEQADYIDQLVSLFAMSGNVSAAALSARADAIDNEPGYFLRADPVHFKADLDHALLIGSQQLAIRKHEAEALIAQFNTHFCDDGLRLWCTHQERWYLQSQQPFNVKTVPTHKAMGRNVQHFLPKGDDEIRWRKLLNEAQMLFFTHEVNRQREAHGQLTINSLWLWGEGETPNSVTSPFDWMMSDEVLVQGLARLAGYECAALNNNVEELAARAGHGLIVIDDAFLPVACGDVHAWHNAVQHICESWIQPLQVLLKNKILSRIHLYTADGRLYTISARHGLKFWRRLQPLQHDINTHA